MDRKTKRDLKKRAKELLKDSGNKEREIPNIINRGKNLTKAIIKHAQNNCEFIEPEMYEERINICNSCDYRNGRICTHPSCGCYLDEKAWWASENCPINKWGEI